MAKRGRNGTMQVLLNRRLVGALRLAGSGAISFTYDQDWLAWEYSMPISLSLPLREEAHQGGPVIAYLENLLPDNQAIRERVAARMRAGGTDAWPCWRRSGAIAWGRCSSSRVNDEELAFYDALAQNQSALEVLGNDELRQIAHVLVEQLQKNVTVDWQRKESAPAKLRVLVRRILKKYRYPPDLAPAAISLVLSQAETLLSWQAPQ